MAKSISATSLKVKNPKAPAVRREAEEPCVGGVTHCWFGNHDCRPRKRNVGTKAKPSGVGSADGFAICSSSGLCILTWIKDADCDRVVWDRQPRLQKGAVVFPQSGTDFRPPGLVA
jgi:hypothetical protein